MLSRVGRDEMADSFNEVAYSGLRGGGEGASGCSGQEVRTPAWVTNQGLTVFAWTWIKNPW